MNSESLRQELLALHINPEDLHVYMDMDGTLYEWRNLSVDIPSDFEDMKEEERAAYINREVYRQLLTPGYYSSLELYPGMAEAVNAMHEAGIDVWINSCSINKQTDAEKRLALTRDFPWLSDDHILLVPDGHGKEKAHYLPAEHICPKLYEADALHVLIDDHTANCGAFDSADIRYRAKTFRAERMHLSAVKCKNDINCRGGKWRGAVMDSGNADIALIQFLEHMKSLPYVYERGNDYADRSDDGILQQE